MERVVITEQDILNAKPYIPLVLKWTLARYIAEISPEKKAITIRENGIDSIALPDMAQRRTGTETQFKIGVFVKEYMGKDFEAVKNEKTNEPIPYLMAADESDAWSNFEAQIDRLKRSKNKEVADKCYDILNDYHAFVRMVSIEIEQELQIRNDIVGRLAWLISEKIGGMSAENLKKNIEELSAIQEELKEAEAKQEG